MNFQRIFVSLVLGLVPWAGAAESPWEKLEDCRVVESPHNDGDSVEIKCHGKRRVIRLYYVDCFEVSPNSQARRIEQAKYFGLPEEKREEAALQIASEATHRTATQLARPFTVYTQGVKVASTEQTPVVRAFVTTADGRDLGELLVSEGLAIIREGKAASEHPDGRNVSEQISALRTAETHARLKGAGAWGLNRKKATIPSPPAGKTAFEAADRNGLFSSAGRLVTVHGRVGRIATLSQGRMIFLDFDGNEEGDFVGIIRADFLPVILEKFPEGLEAALSGKEVTLEGVITLYRNIPQIELQRPEQLTVK